MAASPGGERPDSLPAGATPSTYTDQPPPDSHLSSNAAADISVASQRSLPM